MNDPHYDERMIVDQAMSKAAQGIFRRISGYLYINIVRPTPSNLNIGPNTETVSAGGSLENIGTAFERLNYVERDKCCAGVNLIAFKIRFIKTCLILSISTTSA